VEVGFFLGVGCFSLVGTGGFARVVLVG
jgi:hypothetical protein